MTETNNYTPRLPDQMVQPKRSEKPTASVLVAAGVGGTVLLGAAFFGGWLSGSSSGYDDGWIAAEAARAEAPAESANGVEDSAASADGEASTASVSESATLPVFEIGEPFELGSTRVTVLEAKPLGTKVGGSEERDVSTARGTYYAVSVKTENLGNVPTSHWRGGRLLVGEQQFQSDQDAGSDFFFYDARSHYDEDTYLLDLNPGDSMTMDVVFDLPTGSVPNGFAVKGEGYDEWIFVRL